MPGTPPSDSDRLTLGLPSRSVSAPTASIEPGISRLRRSVLVADTTTPSSASCATADAACTMAPNAAYRSVRERCFMLGLGRAEAGEVVGEDVDLSLIHISEPTRLGMISYAVFCLK